MSDDSSTNSLSQHDLNNYLFVFSILLFCVESCSLLPSLHFSLALNGDATDCPVDIDAIVAALEVDDTCAQDDVLRTIFQSSIILEGERDPYESLPFHSLHLFYLKEMFIKSKPLKQSTISTFAARLKLTLICSPLLIIPRSFGTSESIISIFS
jgi:hypothetical protein